MPFTPNENARIHWLRQGTPGAPLVLLHSIGTDLDIFAEMLPRLESEFDVVRIDLAGHGGSSAPDGEYAMARLARDVLAVMDDAGFATAIVCGVSLGGMVAMELACNSPHRLAALVAANTSAAMSPALWPERIATVRERGLPAIADGWAARHLTAEFMAAHPARVARLDQRFLATDAAGYIGCAAAIRDLDLLPRLPAVALPTLVIAGEHDIATPFEGHGARIAAAIPGAQVAMLPAGHLACIERADLFAGVLTDFANRIPESAGQVT